MTRRQLRHTLLRARNGRVAAGGPTTSTVPVALWLHPLDWQDVQLDGDPAEQLAVDVNGTAFHGVPVGSDVGQERGTVKVVW